MVMVIILVVVVSLIMFCCGDDNDHGNIIIPVMIKILIVVIIDRDNVNKRTIITLDCGNIKYKNKNDFKKQIVTLAITILKLIQVNTSKIINNPQNSITLTIH